MGCITFDIIEQSTLVDLPRALTIVITNYPQEI